MGQSSRIIQSTNGRLLFLVNLQKETKEGSSAWLYYQDLINQIIAQNYLHYVNR